MGRPITRGGWLAGGWLAGWLAGWVMANFSIYYYMVRVT